MSLNVKIWKPKQPNKKIKLEVVRLWVVSLSFQYISVPVQCAFFSVSVSIPFYQSVYFLFSGSCLIPLHVIPLCTSTSSVLFGIFIPSCQCTTTLLQVLYQKENLNLHQIMLIPRICSYQSGMLLPLCWRSSLFLPVSPDPVLWSMSEPATPHTRMYQY
jgi:hypothetical protein